MRRLGNYGSTTKYINEEVGLNSRLDPIQAAVLRAKLPHLDQWNDRRKRLACRYLENLAGTGVRLPEVRPGVEHVWHVFVVRARERDALRAHLHHAGIGTVIHYPVPPHRQKAYASLGYRNRRLPHLGAYPRPGAEPADRPAPLRHGPGSSHRGRSRMERRPSLRQVLRATAVLSGSTVVTVAAGLVTAKVNAIALGPAGVGLYGLLLSVLGLAGLVAGFGIGTGVVRVGAKSVSEGRQEDTAALWSGAWLVFWVLTLPVATALFVFRVPVATALAGGASNATGVAFLAAALIFSLAAGLHVALINAHHRVGVLARYGIYAALLQAGITVGFVLTLGRTGIPYAVLGSQGAAWALARVMALRHVGRRSRAPLKDALSAALGLVRFGGPYFLSQLAGTGARLLIPILVFRLFDESTVGYVRAASAIAVTYLGFLTTAMAQDYYPRLSAMSDQPSRLVVAANQQLEVIYLISVPTIFLAIGLSPVVVPVIYSPAFAPAVGVLQWQLAGDLFRFTSWALVIVILAQGRSSAYFLTETFVGAMLIAASWLAMRGLGLVGVGVGYAITYLLYCILAYAMVRSLVGFRFSSRNARTLLLAGAGILAAKLWVQSSEAALAYLGPTALGIALGVRSIVLARNAWRTHPHDPTGGAKPGR